MFELCLQQRVCTILFAVMVCVSLAGCGYGEVSPLTYEYSKALYSAANRKDSDQLEKVREKIKRSATDGKLPAREANWLNDIIETADDGEWDKAQKEARRIMMDQVE